VKSWLIKANGNFHSFLYDQDFPSKTAFPPNIVLSVLIAYSSATTWNSILALEQTLFTWHLADISISHFSDLKLMEL